MIINVVCPGVIDTSMVAGQIAAHPRLKEFRPIARKRGQPRKSPERRLGYYATTPRRHPPRDAGPTQPEAE
jgi:NAD(P)-dependent dehydrogenase (short-subunit alcohol dehydrogenase family)